MSVSAFVRITRPHNAVVAGFTALIGYLVATGTLILPSLLLAAVVALITAAGNVITMSTTSISIASTVPTGRYPPGRSAFPAQRSTR